MVDDMGEMVRNGRDVLVVDDNPTSLNVIGRRLRRLGFRTMLCSDGPSALDLLHSRAFDIMLIDAQLHGLSGLATLREIRAAPRTADMPVLMMTARSDIGAAVDALAAGADDHVTKPFDFDVLAARLLRLLDRAKRMNELRRTNAALDARIADRAMELGELRNLLDEALADRARLSAMVRSLESARLTA
ncbi:Response regulator receiver domain-containing protein [Sphingomonas laterariae]|uniref:Response regulator receiver domain-containing protein n=2 Tax=Edaphosphingomonas laterariae TaxID=861865 RepID=A0A239FHL1_9SPHN|nr:Response regulator receiver domain-containing protein [Sphingomonas laterariae]